LSPWIKSQIAKELMRLGFPRITILQFIRLWCGLIGINQHSEALLLVPLSRVR
jgi:hypothetical protein